jgi:hypothetical protein
MVQLLNFIEHQRKSDPRESNKDRLEYYGSILKWEDATYRNVLKFFNILGNDFGRNYPIRIVDLNDEKKRASFIDLYDPGGCHRVSDILGRTNPEYLKLYWGLVDMFEVENGIGSYIETILHSFLLISFPWRMHKIFDPMLTSYSAKNNKLIMGNNYYGVHIPYDIIDQWEKIYAKGNFSWYLNNKVFVSDCLTDEIIEKLIPYQRIFPEPKLLKAAN